jgi:hypothetical protein
VLLSQAVDIQHHKVSVDNTINPAYSGRNNGYLAHSRRKLCLINGDNQLQLQAQLADLLSILKKPVKLDKIGNTLDENTLFDLAKQYYQTYLSQAEKRYTIALVADSVVSLINELTLAQQGVASVFTTLASQSSALSKTPLPRSAQLSYWKTPSGSYFTSEPVNQPSHTESFSETDHQFLQHSQQHLQQQSQQHILQQSRHSRQNVTKYPTKR